jgi:hypothetical protein
MKLALLLFGISKLRNYEYYRSGRKCRIDYNLSYINYKKIIFDFFEKKGYDIDVYFTTNILNDKDKKELCEKYNPIKCSFIGNDINHTISRNSKLDSVVELCLKSDIVYDLILITRFDLLFQKDFNESNIQLSKFNLVSILEKDHLICDNFYLFPYKYLAGFSKIVKNNITKSHHRIKGDIESILPENSINYILNERNFVRFLSFYKIAKKINS